MMKAMTDTDRRMAALDLAVTLCVKDAANDLANTGPSNYADSVIKMAAKFDAFLTGCTLDYIAGIEGGSKG